MLVLWRLQRLLHGMRHSLRTDRERNPRTAVVIGRLLGAAFVICFATGIYSHFIQEPLPWMVFPTRPIWLYQVSQGVHITAGIVCFPLLFAKLYAVFPELFQHPPVRSFPNFLERASIALFVSSSLVQLTIGLLNTYQWYQLFPFPFRQTHYALSFVIIGSLAIHIGVKLPVIARYWRKGTPVDDADDPDAVLDQPDEVRRLTGRPQTAGLTGRVFAWIDAVPSPPPSTSRRGFLVAVGAAAAALVATTGGQSFRILDPINLFAPRKNGVGPQALPVNRTAEAADVVDRAMSPTWRLSVIGPSGTVRLSYDELLALPQSRCELPIACVEGWSQMAAWEGPRLRDVIAAVGADAAVDVRVTSIEEGSIYASSTVPANFVADELTLLAVRLNGETLDLDHGYPVRLISPARPGVLQTKWLRQVEVLA